MCAKSAQAAGWRCAWWWAQAVEAQMGVAHAHLAHVLYTVHTRTHLSPSYLLSLGALDDVRLQEQGLLSPAIKQWMMRAKRSERKAPQWHVRRPRHQQGGGFASRMPSFTISSLSALQAPCTRAHTQD